MVKTYIPTESRELTCPACGAGIKAPASARSRRVQCPHCREVVVLENLAKTETSQLPLDATKPTADSARNAADAARIAALEARIAALEASVANHEAALAAQPPATSGDAAPAARKKLRWVASAGDAARDFSPERALALAHNLTTARPREITIRTPAGDRIAGERAAWFKAVFERAGWTVCGPQDFAPAAADTALTLAVPELPVAQEAAETYLALKAAGFAPIPVLDPARTNGTEAPALSLTLPAQKAA